MKTSTLMLLVALCSGCTLGSSESSRFYLLTPIELAESTPSEVDVSVRIAAVELPKHLRGYEIVTRRGGNQIELAEFDRWGEPLEDNFALILSKNLSNLIPTDQVARTPWEGPDKADFLVTVSVLRFDAANETSVLEARWKVAAADLREVVVFRTSEFTEPIEGEGYSAIVAAMSLNLGNLSREIADSIRTLSR